MKTSIHLKKSLTFIGKRRLTPLMMAGCLGSTLAFGQGSTCFGNNLTSNPDRYKRQENFIPVSNEAIKSVRVRFIIIQNSEQVGNKGNFEDTQADKDFLNLLVLKANTKLANMSAPLFPQTCVCGSDCHIPDTRIRIVMAGDPVFVYNPNYYLHDAVSLLGNGLGINTETELNCFFSGDNGGSAGGHANSLPSFTDLNKVQGVVFMNYNKEYELGIVENSLDWKAKALACNFIHELGHTFGLEHLYTQTGYDETQDTNNFEYLEDFWGSGTQGCPQLNIPYREWCSTGPDDTCSMNWMGGYTSSEYREATPMQIGRVHRNMMLSSVRKYVKVSTDVPYNHVVAQNETWEFDIRMYRHIVVEDGAKLTIKCRVLMPPGGKIIVKKGGVLEVDGGIITTVNNTYLWQGIEVWGDNTKSQSPYGSTMHQGKLIVKNDALIENAKEAVRLWNPNDWASSGGIVQATNSTFRNNGRNVEFIAYENHVPNNPTKIINNASYFTDCTFEHTHALNNGLPPNNMVTLWGVRGVQFTKCAFRYDYEPNFTTKAGIYSIDAGYKIEGTCGGMTWPCTGNMQTTKFINMRYGVVATGAAGYYPLSIKNSEFIDCYDAGIVLDDMDAAVVVDNAFINENDNVGYGMYIKNSTGYVVENNSFDKTTGVFDCAIAVVNSSYEENKLYSNNFNSIGTSVVAHGNNYLNSSATNSKGLKFVCNDFNASSSSDIWVTNYGNGAGTIQGTPALSAGNTFSQVYNIMDYRNESPYLVNYYHNGGATMPTYTLNVNSIPTANAHGCPNLQSQKEHDKLQSAGLSTAKSDFAAAHAAYLDAQYMYFSVLDGGSSQQLIALIEGSYPEGAVQLRDQLIGDSPLSEPAALTAIASDVLTNALLYDVLTHNADAVRSSIVITALENREMPAWMITALVNESVNPQQKDTLEMEIAYYDQLRKDHLTNVVLHYSDMTDDDDFDSLMVWLSKTENEHSGIMRKLDLLLAANLDEDVESLIENWETSYPDDGFNQERILVSNFTADFMEHFYTASGPAQHKTWPDSAYFAGLEELANADNGYTSHKAENLIRFNAQDAYLIPSLPSYKTAPESLWEKYRNMEANTMLLDGGGLAVVYPNPTAGRFAIALKDYDGQQLDYEVSDIQGRKMLGSPIRAAITEVDAELAPGVYLMTVKQGSTTVGSLRITIEP